MVHDDDPLLPPPRSSTTRKSSRKTTTTQTEWKKEPPQSRRRRKSSSSSGDHPLSMSSPSSSLGYDIKCKTEESARYSRVVSQASLIVGPSGSWPKQPISHGQLCFLPDHGEALCSCCSLTRTCLLQELSSLLLSGGTRTITTSNGGDRPALDWDIVSAKTRMSILDDTSSRSDSWNSNEDAAAHRDVGRDEDDDSVVHNDTGLYRQDLLKDDFSMFNKQLSAFRQEQERRKTSEPPATTLGTTEQCSSANEKRSLASGSSSNHGVGGEGTKK